MNEPFQTFAELPISEDTKAAIEALGFTEPTSIQQRTILPMLGWHDVIARAPTGTGKTLAFGIPIVEHIEQAQRDVQAVILAPTRELALQIGDDLNQITRTRPWLETVVIYGGQSIRTQITSLRRKPQIIVATPGRLIDHLKRGTVRIDAVEMCVLDEADRMVDMGFVKDVRFILDRMKRVSQIAMFSATLSRAVMDISYLYQREPVEIYVSQEGIDKPDINEYVMRANGVERIQVLTTLFASGQFDRTMIFVNMRQSATMVTNKLKARKLNVDTIHGDISQSQRERVLSRFRKGNLAILVATDVAARGLDIDDVDLVVNYDLPMENENYLHRIGRTGRARKKGIALTFLSPTGDARLQEIMHYVRSEPQFIESVEAITGEDQEN